MTTVLLSAGAQRRRHGGDGVVFRAYPMLGGVASQIEGDYLKGFKHWGVTGGVGTQMYFGDSDRWSLSVEADFSQRGTREYSNSSEIPYNIKGLTLNYIDIPLTFHFTDPWGGITVGAGVVYSRLVSQPHGTLSYNPAYVEPDTTDLTFLRNDLAIAGDIRFAVWRNLMLNLRIQYSLIPVKKGWTFVEHVTASDTEPPKVTVNDCYNFSIGVRLIYMLGESPSGTSRRRFR
ncbi:MAG: hypothetical protein AUK63_1120 [bacterium P3]|nr:MAG: hypothetical protein AUK63_1120 [bacterium P3]KWW40674.1 MAG: hypothetical protein F083_1468 [bacterium F083]